jgi:hypothetical protein
MALFRSVDPLGRAFRAGVSGAIIPSVTTELASQDAYITFVLITVL